MLIVVTHSEKMAELFPIRFQIDRGHLTRTR